MTLTIFAKENQSYMFKKVLIILLDVLYDSTNICFWFSQILRSYRKIQQHDTDKYYQMKPWLPACVWVSISFHSFQRRFHINNLKSYLLIWSLMFHFFQISIVICF